MKSLLSSLSAVLLAVAGTAVHAAEFERAPELPDLSFRSVSQSQADDVPVVHPVVRVVPKSGACPYVLLNGAKISNKGAFNTDKEITIGDKKVGEIDSDGGEYVYKDALGNLAARKAPDGTVTDCTGKKIGSIEEAYSSDASVFTLKDAAGNVVAQTGSFDDIGFTLSAGGKNVAKIDKDHWYSDTVTLAIAPGLDPRLVAIASAQNTASVYKRAGERRRERGPVGGHRI